jgi:stearoyl-CoA desaturase (delta-9 desaturase)
MLEIISLLVMTHITILSVTLYLHRSQAHRAVTFHPVLSHFMRFWLWLTTGMVTKQWVAVHRLHHQRCEQPGDPHSPHVFGIWKVLFKGAWLYNTASKDQKMVAQYGVGTPDDWIERRIYSPHSRMGIMLLLLLNLLCFGYWGILIWAAQMIWIPFWAAGVVNGLGHWWGYRNGETKDRSRNIFPIGLWIGGEELHNNHHLSPGDPRLSLKWWEFDVGWMWIRILSSLRLAEIRSVS